LGGEARREGVLVNEEKPPQTFADIAQFIFKKGFEEAAQGEYNEAIGTLENIAVTLPIMTAAQLQIGRCHWEMHRWELARKHFEIATRLEPDNEDAGWTVGLLALQMGDFQAGWKGYERRWGSNTFKSPRLHTKHPLWERGKGHKRPLIWCEQGIGDQILYASLIEALAKEVDEVTVFVDLRLMSLLQRGCKAKNVKFLSHSARIKMRDHDSHIPIASLGKYFINSVRDIQPNASHGYIKADPDRVKALRKEYGLHEDDFVVGLAWTSTAPVIGPHKSVSLASFKPILDMPFLKFINLQYGEAQKEGVDFHPSLITTHIDAFLDLENVAALIEICSVVVSPSCATVHLAGAMGKDVLLLDANKLWYWNNRLGNESMWYSGVKIYQRENMNAPWDLQIKQVKEELEIILGQRERVRDNFVFFHVGNDTSVPQKMVKSLMRYNPDANIIMLTDKDTPDVMGVTERCEYDLDRDEITFSRVKAFALRNLDEPALYIDTDMIFVDRVVVEDILGDSEIVMCRREFGKDATFNVEQRGVKFDEYEGKTLDEAYPFIACTTATKNGAPWQIMLNMFDKIDPKYRVWYGDQEVLKLYAESEADTMPESVYGCLPEHKHDGAKIIHYKGPSRKQQFEAA
jgi:tetratricopeptide (TPR) repeat protein